MGGDTDQPADKPTGGRRSGSDWSLMVRAAWAGTEAPRVEELVTAVVAGNEDALAEVISADLEERERRGVPWTIAEYAAAAPVLLERGAARRVLFMAAVATDGTLGETPAARASALRARYPGFGADVALVASLGTLLSEAMEAESGFGPGMRRGKYELRERLGSGAFAETWRAMDTVLGREVALKIVSARQLGAQSSERFLAEARSLARVRHESVVTLHEAGRFEEDGAFYLDMELAHGDGGARTLATLMREGPVEVRRAARLASGVALGLAAAHSRGVVHRDIKPANVVLDGSDRPRLADFGLAVEIGAGCVEGRKRGVAGTPAYIAPEVAAGQEPTPLADVFSLGAMLRALLTGTDPRGTGAEGEGSDEVLERAATVPLGPVRACSKGVPATLAAIADRATAHAPEDRYGSASELASDLEAYLGHRATTARRVSAVGRGMLWGRRNGAVAAVVLGASALMCGVTVAFVMGLRRERDHARAAETRAGRERDAAVEARDVIQTQNRFVSRAFNAARGKRGVGAAGAEVGLSESLSMIDTRVEKAFADRPLVLAATYQFLSQANVSIGEYDAAERQARRALEVRERELSAMHPDVIASRCALASVLVTSRNTADGHPMVRALHAEIVGGGLTRTPEGMWVRLWMARVNEAEGRRDEARAELERLAAEYRAEPFNGSMDRQTALNDLVRHYIREGKGELAETAQREIIAFAAERLGEDDISTLNATRTLVVLLRRRGDLAGAAGLNAGLVERYGAILAPDHAAVLSVVNEQVSIELERRSADAVRYAEVAVELTERRSRGDGARVRARIALGRAQHIAGEGARAEATLRAVLDEALDANARGGTAGEVAAALGEVLREQGKGKEADEVDRRIQELRDEKEVSAEK